jgi:1,4-alpha-glucan branching enzyme
VTYLQLATELVRQVNPNAILIAEDMSALPGMCRPVKEGGVGFGYRLAMGQPDLWIRLLKEVPDEHWDLNKIYYELAVRRPGEKQIGYCESHDQALVGDKTLLFRLCDQEMYWHMAKDDDSDVIARGMALHKMLRLLTASLGGEGYLTFMGNEFGHPEWIDFPREGNNWSYHYCRRQWSLSDRPDLKYGYLNEFEKQMVEAVKKYKVQGAQDRQLLLNNTDKVLFYKKGKAYFAFNFHPTRSFDGIVLPVDGPGKYTVKLSTDDHCFGGQGRIYHQSYEAQQNAAGHWVIKMYLPSRTAAVLSK